MADGGWIKVYRKIRQSFVWTDANQLKLWLLLLMKASHDGNKFLFNGQEVSVSSGELVTGAFALASEFNQGVSRDNQVSWRQLWRWVKKFENAEMLTIKSTNKYSVISILHWNDYQTHDKQLSSQRQSSVNPVSTIKNAKNAENAKKESLSGDGNLTPADEFTTEVWPRYPRKQGNFQKAQEAYVQAVESGETTKSKVLAKIDEYKTYIKINNKQTGFIQTAGNWFTGHAWNGEWDTKEPEKKQDSGYQGFQQQEISDDDLPF